MTIAILVVAAIVLVGLITLAAASIKIVSEYQRSLFVWTRRRGTGRA